jgi:hypothetical protein
MLSYEELPSWKSCEEGPNKIVASLHNYKYGKQASACRETLKEWN